jgi:hypothetical protein
MAATTVEALARKVIKNRLMNENKSPLKYATVFILIFLCGALFNVLVLEESWATVVCGFLGAGITIVLIDVLWPQKRGSS